jgi:hypothetical protein
MKARRERFARNESIFREVNERIEEVGASEAAPDERVEFLCECGNEDCTETIAMTLREYERVRSDAAQFVVVPGHEALDLEHPVEESERFRIVRKHPEEAAIAQDSDPRA